MDTKIVTIDLDTRSYDIFIGEGLLYRINDFLPDTIEGKALFIVTDTNVEPYAKRIRDIIKDSGARICELKALPAGEATKCYKNVEDVTGWMLSNGIDRNAMVLAVGGGVIGDLTGFCASIAMRGVPYVQIPTTLLSQVDSSVGGKTGINTAQGKNLIGSFYQPKAVIADIETLKTLERRQLLSGYAEVLKYGLIQDLGFFNWLEDNGERVCKLDPEAVAYAIDISCRAKAAIVEADETERGSRALLNLGHTFGHALEAEAGYNGTLLHGEAISIGMVMAFDLSYRLGDVSEDDFMRVEDHLVKIGLPTRAALIDGLSTNVDRLIEVMGRDKKVIDGKMVFVTVNGIGEAIINNNVDEEIVRDVLIQSLGGEVKEKEVNAPDLQENMNDASKKGLVKGMKGRWKSAFSSRS